MWNLGIGEMRKALKWLSFKKERKRKKKRKEEKKKENPRGYQGMGIGED